MTVGSCAASISALRARSRTMFLVRVIAGSMTVKWPRRHVELRDLQRCTSPPWTPVTTQSTAARNIGQGSAAWCMVHRAIACLRRTAGFRSRLRMCTTVSSGAATANSVRASRLQNRAAIAHGSHSVNYVWRTRTAFPDTTRVTSARESRTKATVDRVECVPQRTCLPSTFVWPTT